MLNILHALKDRAELPFDLNPHLQGDCINLMIQNPFPKSFNFGCLGGRQAVTH